MGGRGGGGEASSVWGDHEQRYISIQNINIFNKYDYINSVYRMKMVCILFCKNRTANIYMKFPDVKQNLSGSCCWPLSASSRWAARTAQSPGCCCPARSSCPPRGRCRSCLVSRAAAGARQRPRHPRCCCCRPRRPPQPE